jgi:membrane-associated protease RseP (regulator of RpoE activity)
MRYKKYLLILGLAAGVAPAAHLEAQGQVIRTVTIRRGWLGINYDMTSETRDGKTTESMIVLDVVDGSPADRAGVRQGDRIVRIDGSAVSLSKFETLSRTIEPGDTLRLRVSNGGRERDLAIVATERPAEFNVPFDRDFLMLSGAHSDSIRAMMRMYFDSARIRFDGLGPDSLFVRRFEMPFPGARVFIDSIGGREKFRFFADTFPGGGRMRIEVRPDIDMDFPQLEMLAGNRAVAGAEFTEINPGLSQYFGTSKGLLVLRVAPESPADQSGLEAGDVLTRIDGSDAVNVESFRRAVTRSLNTTVKLEILRKSKPYTLTLDLKRRRE